MLQPSALASPRRKNSCAATAGPPECRVCSSIIRRPAKTARKPPGAADDVAAHRWFAPAGPRAARSARRLWHRAAAMTDAQAVYNADKAVQRSAGALAVGPP
jgi:hypothetical protein